MIGLLFIFGIFCLLCIVKAVHDKQVKTTGEIALERAENYALNFIELTDTGFTIAGDATYNQLRAAEAGRNRNRITGRSIHRFNHDDSEQTIDIANAVMLGPEVNEPEEGNTHIIQGYHTTKHRTKDLSNDSTIKVGYEIEKTSINGLSQQGGSVDRFDIFRGIETDSSCGVEAITNILPLSSDPGSLDYVKGLMKEAKSIINEPVSTSCGGHITVSVKGLKGSEVFDKVRENAGILYAIYRRRLRTSACGGNIEALEHKSVRSSPMNVKKKTLEFRLPSAVKNVKQLFNRHKLMAVFMENSLAGSDFDTLVEELRPILLEMYSGNEDKVNETIELGYAFNKWLVGVKIPDILKPHLLGGISCSNPFSSNHGFRIPSLSDDSTNEGYTYVNAANSVTWNTSGIRGANVSYDTTDSTLTLNGDI